MRKFSAVVVLAVVAALFIVNPALSERTGRSSGQNMPPTVNSDVQVSPASNPDPHDEPFIAASLSNSQILVAASKVIVGGAADPSRGVSRVAFYNSSDAGATWSSPGLIPLDTPQKTYDWASDPIVATDLAGNFYVCVLMGSSSTSGSLDNGIYVFESTDNGHTFGTAMPVFFDIGKTSSTALILDKPFLTIDTNQNSVYKNSLYVAWVESSPTIVQGGAVFFAGMHPGGTFSDQHIISHHGFFEGPQLAVGPNGEVYGTWEGIGDPKTLLFDASTDGGTTFDNAIGQPQEHDIRLRAFVGSLSPPSPAIIIPGLSRVNTWPTIDVDRSNGPNRGKIYIAWCESTNFINSDILMFTLTPPNGTIPIPSPLMKVSPSGGNQFFPQLSVDSQTGDVYVAYLDQAGQGGTDYAAFLTYSTNGAASFNPSIKVSSQPSSPVVQSFIQGANGEGIGIGDYVGLSFARGRAHVVWTDTRNSKQEIFYDRIDFSNSGGGPSGPANDDCASPRSISTVPFTDSEDTTLATTSGADPTLCSGSQGTNSVWYSITPSADSIYGIDTSGSSYDTVLSVFTGSCGALSQVACNDDFGNLGNKSLLTFQAHAGTTYLIEVTGKGTGGTLNLRVGFPTVTSVAYVKKGPDGTPSLQISGAGFVQNNAQVTVTINSVDTVLPNTFYTGTRFADGTTNMIAANQIKLKKLVKAGLPVTVKVESPVGSGNFSVPFAFTR